MEKLTSVYFIKQVVEVTVPTAISALKFYDVGFHQQLLFLVREFTVYVWIDLLYFYSRVINLIVSLATLRFVLIFSLFVCVKIFNRG